MNSHSKVRVVSTLLLSVAVIAFGSASTSFAASTSAAKSKTAAKVAPKAAVKATAKPAAPNPKITKPPVAGAAGAERGGRFANLTTAQRACLVKNGVTLPAPRAAGVSPSAAPTGVRTPGAGNRGTFNNPKTVAAYKNCGIAVPTGGFGGQFNSVKFQAFQKCMTAAGFQPTGGFGRYDQSDPSTVAALIKCQKSTGFTLPKPGANN